MNNTVYKYLDQKGGVLEGRYLRNTVIGQITKNIEALEKRVKKEQIMKIIIKIII